MKDDDDVPIPFKPWHVYEDLPSVTIYGNGRKYKAHRCDVQDPEVLIRTIVNHGEAAKVLNIVNNPVELINTFRQMLGEVFKDAFDGIVATINPLAQGNVQARVTAVGRCQREWLLLYMTTDEDFVEQKTYLETAPKPFSKSTSEFKQRFDMIHKLTKWFPRTGNPDVNDDIFTQVQIRNWMFTKQPAKHQQTLNAMPHVSYQDMEVAELCKYFDKLQRDEIRETARRCAQEETQRKRRNKTDAEDNYRARAAQGRGRRGNGGRGNGGRGFNSRRSNVRCYKPGHNHLWIHCPENPYRVEDEEEEEDKDPAKKKVRWTKVSSKKNSSRSNNNNNDRHAIDDVAYDSESNDDEDQHVIEESKQETKDEEMPSEEEDGDEPMEADEEPHHMEDIGIEDLEEELESLDINDDEMEDEKKEE
ncbi:hypothetical protein MPSEU_000064500 [Mayamaea pseudoterrestris]|nr:hypothetical protein MPSEU_000063400 [Mayamaea pseudoterrestris]GKY90917.1 hypothetical protein MPSEU_000064500 [Mayamaea pseudoterrestris]